MGPTRLNTPAYRYILPSTATLFTARALVECVPLRVHPTGLLHFSSPNLVLRRDKMSLRKTGKETRIRLLMVFGLLAIAFSIGMSGTGAFAGVPAVNVSQPNSATSAGPTGPSVPFDCSQISRLGIDKQMNLHAD